MRHRTCLLLLSEGKLEKLSELLAPATPHDGVCYIRPCEDDDSSACDVVVHKGAYDSVVQTTDPAAAWRWHQLQQLASRPVLLEPLECVVRFADRLDLCRALDQLAPVVYQPRFAKLDGGDADELCACAAAAGLEYPLVCKPIVACGPRGHQLAVVMRPEGLRELLDRHVEVLRPPFLAQEFVPHGGVVLKGYRVGDLVHTRLKPSLPAFEATAHGPAVVCFDSQQPLDTVLRTGAVQAGASAATGQCPAPAEASRVAPAQRAMGAMLEAVASHMGVELLGIDVLVAPDGRCLVIDANHMSGTPHSVPGFTGALNRLIRRRAEATLAK